LFGRHNFADITAGAALAVAVMYCTIRIYGLDFAYPLDESDTLSSYVASNAAAGQKVLGSDVRV
jgi:hypothetical protein